MDLMAFTMRNLNSLCLLIWFIVLCSKIKIIPANKVISLDTRFSMDRGSISKVSDTVLLMTYEHGFCSVATRFQKKS